jgi:hypothetical protein
VLVLYSRVGPFTDEVVLQAGKFAPPASVLLANAHAYWDACQFAERLQRAIRSRATIEQAIGILMANGGRTPEDAFQMLVHASQRETASCATSPPTWSTAPCAGSSPGKPQSGAWRSALLAVPVVRWWGEVGEVGGAAAEEGFGEIG